VKKTILISSLVFITVVSARYSFAQANLLRNQNANEGSQSWRAYREATVEDVGGNRCFVLRNGSHFIQDVSLAGDLTGQFAVFIGRTSSESTGQRITGSPYLHGYMMNAGDQSGGRIYAYLGG
jgi:hypothetical protein